MALSITHATDADASFSAAGKTAWEEGHFESHDNRGRIERLTMKPIVEKATAH